MLNLSISVDFVDTLHSFNISSAKIMTVAKYGSNAASNVEADESGLNDSLNTSLHNPIFGAKSSLVYRNRKFVGKLN